MPIINHATRRDYVGELCALFAGTPDVGFDALQLSAASPIAPRFDTTAALQAEKRIELVQASAFVATRQRQNWKQTHAPIRALRPAHASMHVGRSIAELFGDGYMTEAQVIAR
jgi:hypothetical protein